MSTTAVQDTISENAYVEVQEYLLERDAKLHTSDIEFAAEELSLDMAGAARHYVLTYAGDSPYVADVRKDLAVRDLSRPQVRGVLNVLLFELRNGDVVLHYPERIEALRLVEPQPEGVQTAMGDASVGGIMNEFESTGQKLQAITENFNESTPPKTIPVITMAEQSRMDISGIPDSRYAIMATENSNDYLFLAVTTLKRPMMRTRQFIYGNKQTGFEELAAGTIEVRQMRGDTRQLVGYQRPGEAYVGQHLRQLIWIAENPKMWALIYSKLIGCCALCGKTLTDDRSRDRGIGPECNGTKGINYWAGFSREGL